MWTVLRIVPIFIEDSNQCLDFEIIILAWLAWSGLWAAMLNRVASQYLISK